MSDPYILMRFKSHGQHFINHGHLQKVKRLINGNYHEGIKVQFSFFHTSTISLKHFKEVTSYMKIDQIRHNEAVSFGL